MLNQDVIENCKKKLLNTKEDLLSLKMTNYNELKDFDTRGDETDQSLRCISEARSIEFNERIRIQLYEIEIALSKIMDGTYGVCEETGEHIEKERLLAIPWTRLSIEGAELRDAQKKQYAR